MRLARRQRAGFGDLRSHRADWLFGRATRTAIAGGLAILLATIVLAQAAGSSTPYPPLFLIPALRQPQATPGSGPAIGFYGSQRFYLAWTGAATNKVFYSALGNNCKHFSLVPCWMRQANVNGSWGKALASDSPALVDYSGAMYAFWPGLATKKVFYSAYNGTSWAPEATVNGSWGTAATEWPVALAVYNGDLYAAWVPWGASSTISYSYFNGSSWSSSAAVPSLPSKRLGSPALVVYDGDLYLFWVAQGAATGYSTYNGSVWSSPASVGGDWGKAVAITGLGLAVCDDDLFAAWVNGPSSAAQNIRYSDFDGSTWTKPVVVGGTKAVLGTPVLGASGETLYLAWAKYLFDKQGNEEGTRALVTYAENVGLPPATVK